MTTASAGAGTALTAGEPPGGMWIAKGSRCVPVRADPYNPGERLARMRVSVLMVKPAEKTVKLFGKGGAEKQLLCLSPTGSPHPHKITVHSECLQKLGNG